MNNLQKELYAILFAAGEPLENERFATAMGIDPPALRQQLELLGQILWEETPFELLCLQNRWQIATKAEYAPKIKIALEVGRNTPLSQAALEVLAILAYNQPATRAFIEQVRGVDSSSVVASLVEKSLLEEAGRLDLPGRPIAYRTTPDFLRCFGLRGIEDLPMVFPEEPSDPNALDGQLEFES